VARRLGITAAATAGLAVSVWWAAGAFGPPSAAFAFAVCWLSMCWMGIAGKLFPPRLPEGWFRLRPCEHDGRVYRWAGVGLLKALVRRGPLHLFNRHLRMPAERTPEHLARLEAGMREAEAAHAVLFVLVLPVVVHAVARGWWWAAWWTLAFDLVLNAWPVALQRANRGRLLRLA